MERKHIILGFGNKTLERNMEFLKRFFCTKELKEASRYFTKTGEKGTRKEIDNEMNLEDYLNLINEEFHFILQLGWYHDDIRYCVKGYDQDLRSRAAWITCPLNQHNYQITSKIFREVYEECLD